MERGVNWFSFSMLLTLAFTCTSLFASHNLSYPHFLLTWSSSLTSSQIDILKMSTTSLRSISSMFSFTYLSHLISHKARHVTFLHHSLHSSHQDRHQYEVLFLHCFVLQHVGIVCSVLTSRKEFLITNSLSWNAMEVRTLEHCN